MQFYQTDDLNQITGLILAGGKGRRVDYRDKGLLSWRGKPLIAHVCERIRPQVAELVISCNRNPDIYKQYAVTVVEDRRADFQGPLAGLEAALPTVSTEYVLVTTCDTPLIPRDLARRLLTVMQEDSALDACFAHDGERAHYLCSFMRNSSLDTLSSFLDTGERAVHRWYRGKRVVAVDFSDCREGFRNFNQME